MRMTVSLYFNSHDFKRTLWLNCEMQYHKSYYVNCIAQVHIKNSVYVSLASLVSFRFVVKITKYLKICCQQNIQATLIFKCWVLSVRRHSVCFAGNPQI